LKVKKGGGQRAVVACEARRCAGEAEPGGRDMAQYACPNGKQARHPGHVSSIVVDAAAVRR
jgi:hypothetical protein